MSPSSVRREWRRSVSHRDALANEIAGYCFCGRTPPAPLLARWNAARLRADRYFIARNPKPETKPEP